MSLEGTNGSGRKTPPSSLYFCGPEIEVALMVREVEETFHNYTNPNLSSKTPKGFYLVGFTVLVM